jgi:hypothetical protein
VTQIQWFQAGTTLNQHLELGITGFGLEPNSLADLTFEFVGPVGTKFKLISITSC